MKILLISENRTTTHLLPFPLGLAFVAGALRRKGHEVAVLDLMFVDDWEERLRSTLADLQPDVIGLSIRNIDNQDMVNPVFFLSDHLEILRVIREYSGAPVVLGGSGFNIHPSGCMQFLEGDLGIYGEGEVAFPLLLDAMDGGAYETIPGAVFRNNGEVRVNPPAFIDDPAQSSMPSYDDFDVRAYHDAQTDLPGCVTVQTKRGCHMKCIYCSTPFLEGTRCRMLDLKGAVAAMARLHRKSDIQRFYIVDNVFNYPLSQAKEFCRVILAQGLSISWQAIVNPAFVDEELFALMGKAGCRFISIGNESGHELILRNLRKGFTLDNVRKAARLARENGIRYACFLLIGGPGETEDTVRQSVSFVEEISPDLVAVKSGIRIYPGTPLEALARDEGMIDDGQDLLQPAFYLSPDIKDWIRGYLEKTVAGKDNWRL